MPGIDANLNLDYSRAVKIADDIYWIGFHDRESGLHCNPYLIVDGGEAVVIDGGSRPDFPTVMMKILKTGVVPSAISALIHQHYDPDLCGSIPNFEDLIDRSDLKVITDSKNAMYIRHYDVSSQVVSLDSIGHGFVFGSGRKLHFFPTPYAHSAGSFVTFDPKSGVLFTSDLFGSTGKQWRLFLDLPLTCRACNDIFHCPEGRNYCPLIDILDFHASVMPSGEALRYAMAVIARIPFSSIAPQHGSVIAGPDSAAAIMEKLISLESVGIDGILKKTGDPAPGDIRPLLKRLETACELNS